MKDKKYSKYLWIVLLALTFTMCQEEEPVIAPASVDIDKIEIVPYYNQADIQWRVNTTITIQKLELEYSTDTAFSDIMRSEMTKVNPKSEEAIYRTHLQSLKENTTYYVRCKVVNKYSSVASEPQTFTTKAWKLTAMQTDSITGVGISSATLYATMIERGTDTIPEVGFCIAKHKEVTIEDSLLACPLSENKDTIPYTTQLEGLEDNTTYFVRAYAKNKKGVSYGAELSFTTVEILLPTLGEVIVSDITYTTAKIESEIKADGGSPILERGICYSTTREPTIENEKVECGTILGTISCNLTELNDGTTYYVRAYATNVKGTSYSETQEFTTNAYGKPVVTTSEVSAVTYTTAICGGEVTADGGQNITERGVCYSFSSNPTIEDSKVIDGSGLGAFTCNLTGLADGKTYYVRAYATNSQGTTYGEEKSFTTREYGKPTVSTSDVTAITYTSATCAGNVIANGGSTVTERGICYSVSQNPTIEDIKIACGEGLGSFSCNISSLAEGETYYVRAYATNSKGTSYGDEKTFTTKEYGKPIVSTGDVTSVTYTSAKCGGEVTADCGQSVTERGVCYSITKNPTIEDSKVVSGSGLGSFTCNLSSLADGKTYYIRAYATNSQGTSYGEEKSFTTNAYGTPTVSTADVKLITYTSASCGGNVIANGGKTVTECGVCYSTSENPTIEGNKVTASTGKSAFTCNLTELSDGTTYYVRAYAVNAQGVGYGQQQSFATNEYALPTVTTSRISSISYTSAICYGEVTTDNDLPIIARGVCYAKTPNPTIADSIVGSGEGTGSFNCRLTDLEDGTIYYARAYATNSKGTGYGEEKSFTTKNYNLATVTTSAVTNIAYTYATCGGNVSTNGGADVTERGICYSTSADPTIDDYKIESGEGLGSFSCNMPELTHGTTYFVRAYAINKKGTSYGEQQQFTTLAYTAPTVITSDTLVYSYNYITCGGEVLQEGYDAVASRGICYSTSPEPTIEDNIVAGGNGIGAFVCTMAELQDGTTYYYRAFASNSKGTGYGEEKFVTTMEYTYPVVNFIKASDITYTSAICGGEVIDEGGFAVTERGIHFYGTSGNSFDTIIPCGSGPGAFTCTITGLKDDTDYRYRAYAKNSVGTGFSQTYWFRTNAYQEPTVTTSSHSNVTYHSATCEGNVTDDGDLPVTVRGICYSANNYYPTINDNVVTSGSGLGAFTCELTNLKDNTYYHYRAFATNGKGTGYGARGDFYTPGAYLPSIQTLPVTNISYTSATFNCGNYSYSGSSVTEIGFCYSTNPNPTIDGSSSTKVAIELKKRTCDITDLSLNTTYYVRAYATNSAGTGYGEEVEFTTLDKRAPVVTTLDATFVSFETAICGGKITDDGLLSITEYGICYSTSLNPSTSDYKVTGDLSQGEFKCGLLDLDNNVTYYYRAYAINERGIGYGEEKSFTTIDYASAVIYYTASEKLPENKNKNASGRIYLDAFDSPISSHEFANGKGTINFVGKLTNIGNGAFRGCTSMTSITLPYSIVNIRDEAFRNCTGLTSFDIPKNVQNVSYSVFYQSRNIASFNVADDNPYLCDVDGVVFSKDKSKLLLYPNSKSDAEYIIPNSVISIETCAFADCENLTSVLIPEGITVLQSGLFKDCHNLVAVLLPNSLTYIFSQAFNGCTNLEEITLPSSVSGISDDAFESCTGLTSITCKAMIPPYCSDVSFRGVNKSIPLYVPSVSVNAYKQAEGWKDFTNIQPIP